MCGTLAVDDNTQPDVVPATTGEAGHSQSSEAGSHHEAASSVDDSNNSPPQSPPPQSPPSNSSGDAGSSTSSDLSESSDSDDELPRARPALTRKKQLENKFVDTPKAEKETRNAAAATGEDVVPASLGSHMMRDFGKRNSADTATDIISTLGLGSDVLGKVAGIPGLIEDKDSKNTHTSAMGIATSGIGTIGAGVSFFNNRYKKNKLLNANRRKAASQRQFASGLDFFGGLFGVASNGGNIGLFGKNNLANKDGGIPQMVGGGLDILSGALGSMANIFKYKANRSDRKAHSDIVSKADEIRGADYARDTADLDQSRQELKNIYAQNGSAPLAQSQALTDARTKRHTAKAKLYAMEQAARMHQVKYDNSSNGGAGLLFGSLGSVGTVLKGFGKMMGSGNGLLAQIGYYTGALGTLAKGINLAHGAYKNSDKGKDKAKKAVEDEKRSIVDSYLNDAAQRIIDDAQQWHPTQAESDNLANTDNDDISDDANIMPVEARRLALMRLGIQVANNADVRNNAHYDEAFKKITEKRANNIINSSANERHSMLEALGLDDDASFDQIYTVLSGETF